MYRRPRASHQSIRSSAVATAHRRNVKAPRPESRRLLPTIAVAVSPECRRAERHDYESQLQRKRAAVSLTLHTQRVPSFLAPTHAREFYADRANRISVPQQGERVPGVGVLDDAIFPARYHEAQRP